MYVCVCAHAYVTHGEMKIHMKYMAKDGVTDDD